MKKTKLAKARYVPVADRHYVLIGSCDEETPSIPCWNKADAKCLATSINDTLSRMLGEKQSNWSTAEYLAEVDRWFVRVGNRVGDPLVNCYNRAHAESLSRWISNTLDKVFGKPVQDDVNH